MQILTESPKYQQKKIGIIAHFHPLPVIWQIFGDGSCTINSWWGYFSSQAHLTTAEKVGTIKGHN